MRIGFGVLGYMLQDCSGQAKGGQMPDAMNRCTRPHGLPEAAGSQRRARTACGISATWMLALSFALGGCTNVVRPPERAQEPTTVYLLDHGRHTSLVLPVDHGMIRYAYGDWRWYALGDTGASQGFAALLTKTPAGLGRRFLAGEGADEAFAQLGVGVEARFSLRVEASAAATLRERLDNLHASASLHVENASANLDFAPHPVPYSMRSNSNTMVGAWREALGCEIEGSLLFADWRIFDNYLPVRGRAITRRF